MKTPLFFDVAATTPQIPESLARYQEVATTAYGNSGSSHSQGLAAARILHEARHFFSAEFQTAPENVIFVSSGTEANNTVITGFALSILERNSPKTEIVISAIEHPCVKKAALELRKLGFAVHTVPVTENAVVTAEALRECLSPSTGLVSLMQVNNIVGSQFPIEALAREIKSRAPQALVHSDTVQAYGRVELPRGGGPVDFISLSAHKIGGPKGIGALIALNSEALRRIRPLILGAGQEFGMRSGTTPVELIAAFHTAAQKKSQIWKSEAQGVRSLCDRFRQGLETHRLLGKVVRWNSPSDAIPHIVCLSLLKGTKRDVLEILDREGIYISGGAACSSLKPDPDPVLSSMGLSEELARGVLRISFSKLHSEADVDRLISALRMALDA